MTTADEPLKDNFQNWTPQGVKGSAINPFFLKPETVFWLCLCITIVNKNLDFGYHNFWNPIHLCLLKNGKEYLWIKCGICKMLELCFLSWDEQHSWYDTKQWARQSWTILLLIMFTRPYAKTSKIKDSTVRHCMRHLKSKSAKRVLFLRRLARNLRMRVCDRTYEPCENNFACTHRSVVTRFASSEAMRYSLQYHYTSYYDKQDF